MKYRSINLEPLDTWAVFVLIIITLANYHIITFASYVLNASNKHKSCLRNVWNNLVYEIQIHKFRTARYMGGFLF
jgi:hypothetical protein